MAIIGFFFVLFLGLALMYAGAILAWTVFAFSGIAGLKRESVVPSALFLFGVGLCILAGYCAPFEITWEMKP